VAADLAASDQGSKFIRPKRSAARLEKERPERKKLVEECV
jgi:hypothetical protein